MEKIYRILGKRGRTTIPYEFRKKYGYGYNDVVSFEDKGDGVVIVRKEKICTHCTAPKVETKETTLLEVLSGLTVSEQKAAFRYLAKKLSDTEEDA